MIEIESNDPPSDFSFDVAITAVGYESRCRWVTESTNFKAKISIALEFGYLTVGAYSSNLEFFRARAFRFVNGLSSDGISSIIEAINVDRSSSRRVLVDVSSMSRSMIANVLYAINAARENGAVEVWASYAASRYSSDYNPGPIRKASPIMRELAGWSPHPEKPLGAIFGLGCEPGLVLGALQVLEPDKVWTFSPKGFDAAFEEEGRKANTNIEDIFDVTPFEYDLSDAKITRGKYEALLNAVGDRFRIITVPFGPKMFSWVTMSTIIFTSRRDVGIWTFSSGDRARALDREAEGPIVWHYQHLSELDYRHCA